MARRYSKTWCPVCKERVSRSGLAFVAHMRKHVREGRAEEFLKPDLSGRMHSEFRVVKKGLLG